MLSLPAPQVAAAAVAEEPAAEVEIPENLTREQARDLPTVGHRGSIAEVDDRAGGTRPVPQTPYRMSGAETGIRGGAPFLGEHNREVLTQWLGMSDEDVDGYAAVLRADPLPDGADR